MGRLHAVEMANSLTLDDALAWHLRSNHYPPIPTTMVQPCKEAIDAYWEDDLGREIKLPEGVSYHGRNSATASAIIINHHLDPWCANEESDSDFEDL